MKQMWEEHVENAIVKLHGRSQCIKHHVIHCFGGGESQIELMLGGMTERGREPRVGITASHATISLRITATGESEESCDAEITNTAKQIESKLGDLVFGTNGVELENVVVDVLRQQGKKLALVDYAFGGAVSVLLHNADVDNSVFSGAKVARAPDEVSQDGLRELAEQVCVDSACDYCVVVSQLYQVADEQKFDLAIASDSVFETFSLKYAGHSGLRASRTSKQILNTIRLFLLRR